MWQQNGYTISTDKQYLQFDVIHQFLSEQSYWAKGVSRQIVERAAEHTALCFAVFHGTVHDKQIGYARVISDLTTFAYLADVFIVPEHRGQGLAKWLVATIVNHPDLQVRRFMLITGDAQGLYARYGFEHITEHEKFMAMLQTNFYLAEAEVK